MQSTAFRGAAVMCALALAHVIYSVPAAAGEGESLPKWGPSIDFEGKAGNLRKIGEADLFLPLAQDDRTLLFGNVRGRIDNNDGKEGNLGLGLRHMLDGGWNIGGYGYFDRRSSENDSLFSQVALGAEALGRDFDLRANTYWPVGERVRQLSAAGGGTGAIELSGTTVVFRAGGGSSSEERALRGFDAEVGWRVPVFDAEGPYDFRVYGGGFRFDDGKVSAIAGPRFRAEFTAYEVPELWQGAKVTVGAEWQHDDARGDQEFVSFRFRIPLQPEPKRRLTRQEQRMTEAVVRDVDIVSTTRSTGGSGGVDEIATTDGGQTLRVFTTTNTTNADLPAAINNVGANSTVVLSGTFSPTTTTTLASNQTLKGGGSIAVKSPSGKTGTFTTAAGTLSTTGLGLARVVDMAAGSTVSNLTFTHTDTTSLNSGVVVIRANGVSGATISNNTITVSSTGVGAATQAISAQNATNLVVSGNTINSSTTGNNAAAEGLVHFTGSATISGNTFNATSAQSLSITTELSSVSIAAGSTGNVIVNGACRDGGGNTGSVSFTNATTCP